MRKLLFSLLVLCGAGYLMAQVTTVPVFIQKGYSDTILINFNPNEGNGGMANATQCYAHTGLITSASSSSSDWKYTGKWRGGEAKYKMTKVGDVWQLVIPNIYSYYGCPETTDIRRMAFVFNDGPNGSLEGKTSDNTDIFIDLIESGLYIDLQPCGNKMLTKGDELTFIGSASENAYLRLTINGVEVAAPDEPTTELTYTYKFDEVGVFEVSFFASEEKNSQPKVETITISVINAVIDSVRPYGMQAGITYPNDSTVSLCLYAGSKTQPAQNVFVVGDFNNWQVSPDYQMYRDGFYFWITFSGLTPGEEYAFQYKVTRADGVIKHISDPYSTKLLHSDDKYEPKKVDPSLKSYPTAPEADGGYVTVINTKPEEFQWSDATLHFKRPDKNNLVIYELWIYDFTPSRSIAGLMDMLDYLQNLGVNAIELMPICEFDGNYNWGYSPNHYFAPDKAYGSEHDYKMLIDECHKRGMAVIIDMVFNHATGQNPQNKLYPYGADLAKNPYFNVNAPHSDNVYEDWNHDFAPARVMFTRALNFWIREFHVDGYRMDLSHGLCGANCNSLMDNIKHYYQQGVLGAESYAEKGEPYFILEHWGSNMGSQRPQLVSQGMMCWSNTNDAYSQLAMGWLSNDGLSSANQKGYVTYCESHDEERNFYKVKTYGNGSAKANYLTEGLNRVPITRLFNVLLQGPKMLFQYEELGYDYSINSTKGSSNISENNRTSIKEQPIALGWLTNMDRMRQYGQVMQAIQLRTRLRPDIFTKGTIGNLKLSSGAVKNFTWTLGDDKIVVIGNFYVNEPTNAASTFSPYQTLTPFPTTGLWYDYINEQEINVTSTDQTITLGPGEYRILTNFKLELPCVGLQNTEATVANVYPTIATDIIYIDMPEQQNVNVDIYNMQGKHCGSYTNVNQINVSNLPTGTYLLRLTEQNKIENIRIIKK